jgi:hypothetical protein
MGRQPGVLGVEKMLKDGLQRWGGGAIPRARHWL